MGGEGGVGVLGGADNVLVYKRSCICVLDTLFTFASDGLTRVRCFGFDILTLVSGGVWAWGWVWRGIRTFTSTSVPATTCLHAVLLCISYFATRMISFFCALLEEFLK